ncbi:hypothetical protein SteCoe_23252 [Stentor coeruleus]|uniref:Uncharacterized protein n=1 Tax=Stentor coeruleus TaxID=5963 RepID=A0A1R2BKS1_9CILI|nr:hypothetical protein SteCoe_23252 [Stentor coeruleus]
MSNVSSIPGIRKSIVETSGSSQSSSKIEASADQTTVINVENYPECEEIDKNKNTNESVFSPRLKQKKKPIAPPQSSEKPQDPKSKKNFNEFLSKMEQFQRAKNEKINILQALKKEQEEKEIKCIPKVKMSEKSKKILEEKKKKVESNNEIAGIAKFLPFTPSPQVPKNLSNTKSQSNSTKTLINKQLFDNQTKPLIDEYASTSSLSKPKLQPTIKDSPISNSNTEKVLASKFIKEYNQKFDEISKGKLTLDANKTKELLKILFFMSDNIESSLKKDNEEKLFVKLWKITGAEDCQEILMENLRTFLMGVMNFFLASMSHGDDSVGFGKIVSGKYYLNQEEVLRIHKMFLMFYDNRMVGLKKISAQNNIEKLIKMEDVMKAIKNKEPKILYTGGKSNEISKLTKILSEKNLKPSTSNVKSPRVSSTKRVQKQISRIEHFKTPGPKRVHANLNTSFRSARSKSGSRPQSRLARLDSKRSSISEAEGQIITSDKISDPSILLKAQDLLGAFASKHKKEKQPKGQQNEVRVKNRPKAETRENMQKEKLNDKKNEPGQDTEDKDKEKNDGISSSKLIFKKKQRLKSLGSSKNFDLDLRKATELIKKNLNKSPEKLGYYDEVVVDVNMPDGSMKTLVIPQGSNQKAIVSKFVKENGLSAEMGRTLLENILNSY